MSTVLGAGSAPQAEDAGPDPLEKLWWLLPIQPLARDSGSCLASGEPLLQHLQASCHQQLCTGDAGPAWDVLSSGAGYGLLPGGGTPSVP